MKKIILIGCPGSGKTTFGKALSEKTGLPIVHLDKISHIDNWEIIEKSEFDKRLQGELQKEEWIIDGNYNRTIKHRLRYCDTVFYFDLPTAVCLYSAAKRTIENYGKTRDDVSGRCIEKFDKEKVGFFKSIITFNRQHRKKYIAMLKECKNIDAIIFKSRKEVNEYLRKLGG